MIETETRTGKGCTMKAETNETNKPRTIKETLATIRALGLTASRNAETGEYRVNYRGGTESGAYYTNCGDDAISTAETMFHSRAAAGRISTGFTPETRWNHYQFGQDTHDRD